MMQVNGALFDQAEARILSWSGDGTVRLWDAATGQPRGAPMKHDGAVNGALFDQAQARILSWSDDGTVRLWDAATGQPRGAPMKHDGRGPGRAVRPGASPHPVVVCVTAPCGSGMRRPGSRAARR